MPLAAPDAENLAGRWLRRLGTPDRATAFIRKSNLPFVMMPNDKGTMDESLPLYMGHYGGIWSSSPEVCKVVEAADLIVDIGGLLTHELNTGMWTSVPKAERIVSIQTTGYASKTRFS